MEAFSPNPNCADITKRSINSVDRYLGMELLGHISALFLILKMIAMMFYIVAGPAIVTGPPCISINSV